MNALEIGCLVILAFLIGVIVGTTDKSKFFK